MEQNGTQIRQRVVLVVAPFQGHITPILQIGSILHAKGFSITIAHAEFNPPHSSNHPEFVFVPLSTNLSDYDIPSTFLSTMNVNCKEPLKTYVVQTLEKQEPRDRVCCIIYDSMMYFAEAVAADLKIPSILYHNSSASYVLARHATPRLHKQGYIPVQESMSNELVPELHPLRFKDLPFRQISETLLKLIANGNNVRSSAAVICNTNDFLEHSQLSQLQEECQVPIFSIGPLHKMAPASLTTSLLKEDTSCLAWLDNQAPKSVIYVSLGSVATVDKKEITETAWGLANSGQPFLWILRPGMVLNSEDASDKWLDLLPEGFEERVRERGLIVEWAPQKEVLSHSAVGGFFSHAGWNSALESLSEGVPMICRPCFADHHVNARHITHVWKVGLEMDLVLEREGIERAIRRVMLEKEGEEMRQRAIDMKQKIITCVQKGGSADNSLNDLVELISSKSNAKNDTATLIES
ncbi:unnamed protein product [Ilex paraguariensis]|uniref:Glycosyltransferase n=1 Tax=Ilex paraguariensis TaxID=185542 RepID=A0ABC8TUJ9_9AQUA